MEWKEYEKTIHNITPKERYVKSVRKLEFIIDRVLPLLLIL